MKYPFLDNNELILFDYLPGASGQLLLRLWAELDGKIEAEYKDILSSHYINEHPASREINYEIAIPKRITNWFYDRCQPETIEEQLIFYELLGTHLVAQQQRWNWNNKQAKFFYPNEEYELKNNRVLYGIHTWHYDINFSELSNKKPNLKFISLIPQTFRGKLYQLRRCLICYPKVGDWENWANISRNFNEHSKHYNKFDLQTKLVDLEYGEFDTILLWLKDNIGDSYDSTKESRCIEILNTYYKEIVSNVSTSN